MTPAELEPWSRAYGLAAKSAIPFWHARPRAGTPHIRVLRALAIAFGVSTTLILLISLQLGPFEGRFAGWPTTLWAGAAVTSVAGFTIVRRSKSRLVVGAITPDEAALRYRERMFLSVAFAQAPALVALTVLFRSETLAPYLISLPISLALISWASPREADINRLQEAIADSGGSVDLIAGLMEAPDWTAVRSRRRKGRRGGS